MFKYYINIKVIISYSKVTLPVTHHESGSYIFFYFLKKCYYFMCMGVFPGCIAVHHAHACCQWRPERASDAWIWSYRWLWGSVWGLGSKAGPLEQQPGLLITKPTVQTQKWIFLESSRSDSMSWCNVSCYLHNPVYCATEPSSFKNMQKLSKFGNENQDQK